MQLGAAPVAALLVPLDAVARHEADEVRNRLVLVHLLRVLLLDGKRLETTHCDYCLFFTLLVVFLFRLLQLKTKVFVGEDHVSRAIFISRILLENGLFLKTEK